MQIAVNKKKLGEEPEMWLRRAGYAYLPARGNEPASFARRLGREFYPRFPVYFTEAADTSGQTIVKFNLHLDQKRPGYEGYSRHNAEYEGERVEQEAARLSRLFLPDLFI